MTTLRQFAPLIILDYITDVFRYANHGHTYYELIYLNKGKGIHFMNNIQIPYQPGDLFLLSPGDRHHFDIEEATQFTVIKFTDAYFGNHIDQKKNNSLVIPQVIMQMQSFKEFTLQFTGEHQLALQRTISTIAAFKDFKNVERLSHVYFQLLSIFGLIKDVLASSYPLIRSGKMDKQKLIAYIHQNIYDPKKFKIKAIAVHFGISASYFGDYFKRNFGASYRDYLNQYRIHLIKLRIEGNQLNMKEIAQEFGFSDESHFSNYVNKHLQMRPAAYRKS